ncbi:MAG: hypothetical protein DSY76_08670 [Bacteroidetes bacterium]|nr:MAG: hypothetical protein DSY76_08670 [Bacteroidota bacterium]
MKSLFYILMLSFFLMAQSNAGWAQAQSIATISVDSAYSLTQFYANDPNFIIIDLQMAPKYTAGHIKNAVSLDFGRTDFSSVLDSLDKNKIYLIYCTAGSRSGRTKDSMQVRNFQTVYNMHGGFNTWKSKYPKDTTVAPLLLKYGSKTLNFSYVPTGQSKALTIKLTNGANDTLKFSSFTDPANPVFTTDFSTNPQLTGFDDYTFHITYSPTNLNKDTSSITLYSNGGVMTIRLIAHGSAVGISNSSAPKSFRIYPNPASEYIVVELSGKEDEIYQLINANGKLIKEFTIEGQSKKIPVSTLSSGLYFISNTKTRVPFIKK